MSRRNLGEDFSRLVKDPASCVRRQSLQMNVLESNWKSAASDARARLLAQRWQRLCASYLPRAPKRSMWRYNRGRRRGEPECGWKLHISATILNAPAILKRTAPLLVHGGVQFKVARSLADVMRLNSGLYQGYSQIGKIITVYPRSEKEAVLLAEQLHKLTSRFRGPSVPFDLRFTETSNIYYRYGAFKQIGIKQADGRRVFGIKSPDGTLVPDVREEPKPHWVRDPFVGPGPRGRKRKAQSEAAAAFRVLQAIIQRGKGGVYQAIDTRSNPPRLCLLKEGRKHGETTWDGRDGAWRVRNEERVLKQLSACGLTVPRVHSAFEAEGNYYLVMDFLDGESLHDFLLRRRKRLSLRSALFYGVQLASFLSQMHCAGWAWRDCKPKNIIVSREGKLIPIDFEGAMKIDEPDLLRWSTPAFTPSESRQGEGVADDVYGLGSLLYLLLSGRVFDPTQPIAIEKLRRNIPVEIQRLIGLLLSDEAKARPPAQAARARLNSALLLISRQGPIMLEDAKAA